MPTSDKNVCGDVTMRLTASALMALSGASLVALLFPAIQGGPAPWLYAEARAETPGVTEKEAFDAAKELGTADAWNAFLASYPTGFHADLARAYLKKLSEQAPASAPPAQAAAPVNMDFPIEAGTWGGIVRNGPGQGYDKLDSLAEGESVALMGVSPELENGFPWFKIWYGPEQRKGYMWGGILCAKGVARPDVFQMCPAAPRQRSEVNKVPEGCAKGRVLVDGKCIKKADAASYCGPGYRLEGKKCVQGYQPPQPQKELPSWQAEAIKHGCRKGMGWNAQEGCHEND